MADDEDKPDSGDSATATGAAGETPEAQERTFTQAQLDVIVATRSAKAAKAAEKRVRSEYEGANTNSQSATKKEAEQPGSEDWAAKVAALEQKAAISDAMNELDWKPTKDQAETLRDAFKSGGQTLFDRLATLIKPTAGTQQTEAKKMDDPTYNSPGAPSGAPADVLERDAVRWSKDYIDRMRADGTFKDAIEKYRASLPGGNNGLFRKRIPR
jgi:hypothetical protein